MDTWESVLLQALRQQTSTDTLAWPMNQVAHTYNSCGTEMMKYQLAVILRHNRVAEYYKSQVFKEDDPETIQSLLQLASRLGLAKLRDDIMTYCINKVIC